MATYNLVGDGTLTLYDRVFVDFADDDISAVTFPNDLVTMKTGKNGNTIYVKNEQGRNASASIRLIRGSGDDRFLQSKLAAMKASFETTELAFGEFVIRVADGEGGVVRDVYSLSGGIITKPVEGKENVSGDTTQGVSMYTLNFADSTRVAQ